MAVAAVQTIRRLLISEARPVGYDKLAGDINKTKAAQDGLARSTDKVVKEQLSAARAADKLRMSIDSEYRASVQMARGQQVLNRALEQGTIDARTYARQLDLLENKFNKAALAQSRFGRMGAGAAGFVGGMAGGVAIQAAMSIPSAINTTVADLARIQDIADRIGASTDRIQAFRFAVQQSGGSLENADTALQNFAQRSGDAANKTGELYKLFVANNVAVKDANTNLRNFADMIKNAADEQQAMAIAADGFGKGVGREVVVALRNGSVGLDQFADAARKAGAIVDSELIARTAKIDDEMVALRASISGVSNSLIAEFGAPALLGTLQGLQTVLSGIKTTIEGIRSGGFTTPIPEVVQSISRPQSPGFRVDRAFTPFTDSKTQGEFDAFNASGASPLSLTVTKPVPTAMSSAGSASRSASSGASAGLAESEASATQKVIEALREEERQLAMTDVQKRISNELSAAKVSATSAEGAAIRNLVISIETQKAAMERIKAAYSQAGEHTNDFFQNLIINGQSAQEALSGLLKQMASDLLRFAITGQGPMAALMGGGATTGGGIFGLVGKGIFGGSTGAPAAGAVNVNINGATGNSEVRGLVAQGVGVALSNDRKSLQDRVTGINRDSSSRRVRLA